MTTTSQMQAEFRGGEITETDAYYLGRNSIGDCGEVWYKMEDCSEVNSEALKASYKRSVRSVRSEINLSNDTEWDE